MQAEPVSPELVLVDPELARRERAKLEERAQLRTIHDADDLRHAFERTLPAPGMRDEFAVRRSGELAFARRRLIPAALLCSLLVNGYLAAKLLTRTDEAAMGVAAPLPSLTVSTADDNVSSTHSVVHNALQRKPRRREAARPAQIQKTAVEQKNKAAVEQQNKAAVEQKLVSLILAAPAKKVPPSFLDPKTGLIRTNVQVACRPDTKRDFLCVISSPTDRLGAGLKVRYRVLENGRGVFTWSGYRK